MYVYSRAWSVFRVLGLVKPESFMSEDTSKSSFNKHSSYITRARLIYYPVIYLIQVTALWADRGWEAYTWKRSFPLCALHITTNCLQGFMNAVVYSCTEIVFYEWSRCLRGRRSDTYEQFEGFKYNSMIGDYDSVFSMGKEYSDSTIISNKNSK